MTKLFIVESPGKIKKLSHYLGPNFKVQASVGHIRDLPQRNLGVEPPDFVPHYEVTKEDVVKKLRAAAKQADEVILATDLDREGEAIAYHLQEVLHLKNPKRVVYSEITKPALQAALADARQIDMGMVRAQEGRRVLDRLVGYRVSSVLCDATGSRLSAGRVQTPAIMLVVMREREIESFVPTNHFGVRAFFTTSGRAWAADWNFKPLAGKEQPYWQDEAFAKLVAGLKAFKVTSVETKEQSRSAPPPFTSSSMQQAASSRLGMRPKQTMEHAQKLFEAGVITYHRTDSLNMSQEAVEGIWAVLRGMDMGEYVPALANIWKAKAGAQEAHECIRPTDFNIRKPENVSADQARLYDLIWHRTVASQMKPQKLDVTTVKLLSDEKVAGYGDRQQEFIAKGSVEKFKGWRAVYDEPDEEGEDGQIGPPILPEGAACLADKTELQKKKTQPPPRYTEAALVKKLEDEGIGRPSTYASIIDTLYRREYVREEKKKLIPTPIAFKVVDALVGKFQFADLPYTRRVEEDLDLIAQGKKSYRDLMDEVNEQLTIELRQFNGADLGAGVVRFPCPAEGCEGHLRRAVAKKGPNKGNPFWACDRYPDCKESRPDAGGKPGEKKAPVKGDDRFPCAECGKLMALREGKKGSKFWGCTGYPNCKAPLIDDDNGKPAARVDCPKCGKRLRRMIAKGGPNKGNAFWGCTGYPDCEFTAQDNQGKPTLEA